MQVEYSGVSHGGKRWIDRRRDRSHHAVETDDVAKNIDDHRTRAGLRTAVVAKAGRTPANHDLRSECAGGARLGRYGIAVVRLLLGREVLRHVNRQNEAQ